jgi:hypothetical protein
MLYLSLDSTGPQWLLVDDSIGDVWCGVLGPPVDLERDRSQAVSFMCQKWVVRLILLVSMGCSRSYRALDSKPVGMDHLVPFCIDGSSEEAVDTLLVMRVAGKNGPTNLSPIDLDSDLPILLFWQSFAEF